MLFLLLGSGVVHGSLAPEFTLTDVDGNAFSLSDFRGKMVIIEFFATWCGHCINEISHLKTVHDEFGEELVIISISKSDISNTQLINFRNKYQIPWIVAKDTANVFQLYNVPAVPNLYLIDNEGVTAYNHLGEVEASILIAKVNELLTAHTEPPVIPTPAPPIISVLSPENKTYSQNVCMNGCTVAVPLTFSVSEPTSWIGFSLDGQENVTISGNTILTGLLDGVHYVAVYANDTVGNMRASNIVHFTVDTTPPKITKISQTPLKNNVLPEDEVKVNATVTDDLSGVKQVVLNYTKGNGVWVTVNMTNLEENIWNANIPTFPHGTNTTYTIMVEDNLGNAITTEKLGYEYKVIPESKVIPEFPYILLILPIFMTALLLALIVYRRDFMT
jgi:peroxiredoxin